MLDKLKKMKPDFHLSDRQLEAATKFAKGAEWWCASGVVFWGGAVVLGSAALGLQAMGVPIPATVGAATLVTGGLMTAKSVVLTKVFRELHKKGVKEKESRLRASGRPVPSAPAAASGFKFSKAGVKFNAKAALSQVKKKLPRPSFSRHRQAPPAHAR
jgi:hypothetical protein